jgi:hypothetical protein
VNFSPSDASEQTATLNATVPDCERDGLPGIPPGLGVGGGQGPDRLGQRLFTGRPPDLQDEVGGVGEEPVAGRGHRSGAYGPARTAAQVGRSGDRLRAGGRGPEVRPLTGPGPGAGAEFILSGLGPDPAPPPAR